MKTFVISCFFGLLLAVGAKTSFGQVGSSNWELHPLLGSEISHAELKRYGLFGDMPEIRRHIVSVRFDSIGNDIFIANLLLQDDTYRSRGFSTGEIGLLRKQIEQGGQSILKDWQQLQHIWEAGERPELRVHTHSGEILRGSLLSLNEEGFSLQQSSGVFQFVLTDVARIAFDGEDFDSQSRYGFEHPRAYQYFLAPSAIPMRKGEWAYQNMELGLNGISYGISNHVSVTAGMEPISGLVSLVKAEPSVTGYAGIKVATPLGKKWHVGGGVMGGTLGLMKDYSMLLGYGTATYGSKDHNLSLGAGLSSIGGDPVQPLFMLSGITRLNQRLALVTDNWLLVETRRDPERVYDQRVNDWVPTGNTSVYQEAWWLLSGGLRVMNERLSVDLGLMAVGQAGRSYISETKALEWKGAEWLKIPLPYVGLSVGL